MHDAFEVAIISKHFRGIQSSKAHQQLLMSQTKSNLQQEAALNPIGTQGGYFMQSVLDCYLLFRTSVHVLCENDLFRIVW